MLMKLLGRLLTIQQRAPNEVPEMVPIPRKKDPRVVLLLDFCGTAAKFGSLHGNAAVSYERVLKLARTCGDVIRAMAFYAQAVLEKYPRTTGELELLGFDTYVVSKLDYDSKTHLNRVDEALLSQARFFVQRDVVDTLVVVNENPMVEAGMHRIVAGTHITVVMVKPSQLGNEFIAGPDEPRLIVPHDAVAREQVCSVATAHPPHEAANDAPSKEDIAMMGRITEEVRDAARLLEAHETIPEYLLHVAHMIRETNMVAWTQLNGRFNTTDGVESALLKSWGEQYPTPRLYIRIIVDWLIRTGTLRELKIGQKGSSARKPLYRYELGKAKIDPRPPH